MSKEFSIRHSCGHSKSTRKDKSRTKLEHGECDGTERKELKNPKARPKCEKMEKQWQRERLPTWAANLQVEGSNQHLRNQLGDKASKKTLDWMNSANKPVSRDTKAGKATSEPSAKNTTKNILKKQPEKQNTRVS